MTDENGQERITVQEYGILVSQCGVNAIYAGIIPFLIGTFGAPQLLKPFSRFAYTGYETKLVFGLATGLFLSVTTCRKFRENCEKEIAKKIIIPWYEGR